MIKTLKPGIEKNFLKIIKGIYEKHRAKIILNSKRLKAFPLKSGTTQVLHSLNFYSTLYWRFLARAIRQGKDREKTSR